jgi:hypothetical protein
MTGCTSTVGNAERYVRYIDRNSFEPSPVTAPIKLLATTPPGVSRECTRSRNSAVVRWKGSESEK